MAVNFKSCRIRTWNWWLIFGFLITFSYGGLVYFFIRQYDIGILDKIAELDLNAVGDMLAGIFAPLAFLWLFVATMMQAEELKLQRKELSETRSVMSDQAAAANEQATNSALQNQAMRDQIELQKTVAESTNMVALFGLRYSLYRVMVDFLTKDRIHSVDELEGVFANVQQIEFVFGSDLREPVNDILSKIKDYTIAMFRWEKSYGLHGITKFSDFAINFNDDKL